MSQVLPSELCWPTAIIPVATPRFLFSLRDGNKNREREDIDAKIRQAVKSTLNKMSRAIGRRAIDEDP